MEGRTFQTTNTGISNILGIAICIKAMACVALQGTMTMMNMPFKGSEKMSESFWRDKIVRP